MPTNNSLTLVIFGASGDLTKRKLMPSIYACFHNKLLPEGFVVLGVGRTALDDASFRDKMRNELLSSIPKERLDETTLNDFVKLLNYQSLNPENPEDYNKLTLKLQEVSTDHSTTGNCIFYLATPPELHSVIPTNLALLGLNREELNREDGLNRKYGGWKRLIVEKPFGRDLKSAQELNKELLKSFNEAQVYRIDHFLGKETVQNILVFRFANEILSDLWNYRHIDYVEITTAEFLGVEKRGAYYDQAGAVRDMVQNHLLQVLATVAMEPPLSFDGDSMRYEALKVFKSLRRIRDDEMQKHVVFGQYTASTLHGEKIPGYREEEGIAPDSRTDTFAALKLFIDNSRWYGVPFYLRVGKRLPTRVSEVVVHFKKALHPAFRACEEMMGEQNELILRIQPDEGILWKIGMKMPGPGFKLKTVGMDFHYSELVDSYIPEAYERLLLDCMKGDRTLYAGSEEVEECWEFVDPYLQYKEREGRVFGYPAGTWGPKEAEELMQRDGRVWRYPCKNLAHDGEYCEL